MIIMFSSALMNTINTLVTGSSANSASNSGEFKDVLDYLKEFKN